MQWLGLKRRSPTWNRLTATVRLLPEQVIQFCSGKAVEEATAHVLQQRGHGLPRLKLLTETLHMGGGVTRYRILILHSSKHRFGRTVQVLTLETSDLEVTLVQIQCHRTKHKTCSYACIFCLKEVQHGHACAVAYGIWVVVFAQRDS